MSTDGSNLITDITPLALSDNFYTWFTRTNLLIDAINPLNIYDITPRKGLTESRSGGNVIIDVDTGKGLKAYPNDATGKLTLDFESLTASASVANDDLFVIETPTTGVSNDVYKISASAMLPPTLTGNHAFTGTITASVLNVNDNAIRLQYGDTITEDDAGLILDTTTSSKVKFTYDLARAAWFSNRNIGLQTGYSFLTNSNNRRGDFKFSTHGSNQYDVGLELLMGQQSTQGDDHSWLIEARNVDRALNFIYKTYVNTDVENRIFYAQIDTVSPITSTFVISDKIQIGNVAGSTTNFKSVTDYSSSIIPISNSNGILDSKWTNRYVSSTYSSGLAVGDIVKIYNDTNSQATVVKCALTSVSDDSEAYSLGIVERINGGKVWVVTHGEFSNVTGLDPGSVYYLTSGTPNYTLTKPTTGIVKPVFVATSSTTGVIFPMSSQGLSFGRFNATASGGTLVSGSTVSSDAPNDIFTLVAGSGISLETTPGSKSITIRASTAGNQPTYSSIIPNSGNTISAITPGETLTIQGIGGVEVIGDDNTAGDVLNIRGKYYRNVYCTGESTNDDTFTLTATNYDDTLNFYAGPGINIKSYAGGLKIEATGSSIPSILDYSVTLKKLEKQTKGSILLSGTTIGSGVAEIQALQGSNNSILIGVGNTIQWGGSSTFLNTIIANPNTSTGLYDILLADRRTLGFAIFDSTYTQKDANATVAFTYDSLTYNGAVVGLVEGDGITIDYYNDIASLPGPELIPYIKISSNGGSSFRNLYISTTGETIKADASGNLRFVTPSGSPISFDSDTNSDTVYFNVASNSITNSYLAVMADNTVKVGTGTTNTNNTPQDLLINTNSVLGRVGTSDLKSLSAAELNQILSGKYFTQVTTDSGNLYPTDTTTLNLRGGSGINVIIDTNNQITITATGGGAQTGLDIIGKYDNTTSVYTSQTPNGITSKIYFSDKYGIKSDIDQDLTKKTIITQGFNWNRIDDTYQSTGVESSPNQGSGILYGKSTGSSYTTKFAQVGNGVSGGQLPYINVSAGTGTLSYLNRATTQTTTIDRVVGFDSSGNSVVSGQFVGSINLLNISNLSMSVSAGVGTLTASTTAPVTFPLIQSSSGVYFGPSSSLGLVMQDGGSDGKSDFTLATSDSLATTWTSGSYVTSMYLAGSGLSGSSCTSHTSSQIRTRYFGTSAWANLSAATSPRICMPNFLIGTGPDASTATTGSGVYLRNDTTNNGLIFTNYNLSTNASKTTEKDRSCRVGLEVLDVDTGSTAYASSKNTAYITHTYVPASLSTTTVDSFTVSGTTKKSYKYLVHAQNSGGDFYTTELLIQIKGTTANILQYASSTTSSSLTVSFSVAVVGTTATISHSNTAGSLDIKLIKYEV